MTRRPPTFAGLGITSRLMLWFLAISVIPCAILTVVLSYLSRQSLETSVRDRLHLVSESKSTQLENFVRERRGDAMILGTAPGVIRAVGELGKALAAHGVGSPEYDRLLEFFAPEFTRFADYYGYKNLFLYDARGVLLMQEAPSLELGVALANGPMRGTEYADVHARARAQLQPVVSDYQLYAGHKEPAGYMATPILSEGVLIGVVVFEFGNNQVFSVFNDHAGLGVTGETLVGMLDGDQITFVSSSRFDPDSAFKRRLRLGGREGVPMQRAVQGVRGDGATVDYRSRPVMGVWTYIPSFRWGLVIKQDDVEAFALVRHQRWATAVLVGVTLLAVAVVALTVSRTISRPVREAARVAEAVASGDLTRQVVQVYAPGEAGQLLDAVRTMTRDLRVLISKIQRSSVSLMSTATEIAATSKQQEQTVIDYGASTSQAAAAVKQITATGNELLKTMTEVNGVAGHTAGLANAGQEGLGEMDRTMRLLADSTGSIGAKLSVISERAADINLAVTTITKVADQTNLLSINAAIEAEKAGEYGLGFLVVAREIRRLADQTAVATLDIERMVKEMQSSVAAGVMEMDKFSDQVRQGVVEVGKTNEQLGRIIGAVQLLTEQFEQVTEGMRVQNQGADQIREAVVRIDEGAVRTSVSLREFNKATAHLREAVGGLKEEVSRFTLEDASASAPPALAAARA